MGEAQKKRRIGVGMKPRGEQRQRGPEGSSAGNEHNEASTTEGQPESILDPVLNQMKQAETSSLATQETVQNLDSEKAEKEASPLHSLNSEEEEVALNNALAESGPVVIGLSQGFTPETSADEVLGKDWKMKDLTEGSPTAIHMSEIGTFVDYGKPVDHDDRTDAAALAGAIEGDGLGLKAGLMASRERLKHLKPLDLTQLQHVPELGPQPNGTLKVAVTIEEGYASAVKEWAEADGLSLEEWLTNLVTANIETYAMPAKGR